LPSQWGAFSIPRPVGVTRRTFLISRKGKMFFENIREGKNILVNLPSGGTSGPGGAFFYK